MMVVKYSNFLFTVLLSFFVFLCSALPLGSARGLHSLNTPPHKGKLLQMDRIRALQGGALRLAGERPKGKRGRTPTFLSFAYTQTIVRLYPNDRSPIRKRLCAYTRFETHFRSMSHQGQSFLCHVIRNLRRGCVSKSKNARAEINSCFALTRVHYLFLYIFIYSQAEQPPPGL